MHGFGFYDKFFISSIDLDFILRHENSKTSCVSNYPQTLRMLVDKIPMFGLDSIDKVLQFTLKESCK